MRSLAFDGVTLVPDRRDDGTNVLRLPARATDFRFAYGPGSFRAHRAEAMRTGLAVRVVRNPNLAYDVDWPADVDELMRTTARLATPASPPVVPLSLTPPPPPSPPSAP